VRVSSGTEGDYTLQVKADDQDGNADTYAVDVVTFRVINSELLYVSINGSDAIPREDISDTQPLRTIQKALDYAGPGDDIILLPESISNPQPTTFSEANLTFPESGTQENPIIVRTRTSDQGLITIRPFSGNVAFNLHQRNHIHFQGLTFDGFTVAAIDINDSHDINIDKCRFSENAVGVRMNTAQLVFTTDNFFAANDIGVEFLSGSSNNLIDSTRFSRNKHYGIFMNFGGNNLNNTIMRSTFYRNGTLFDDVTKHAAVNMENNPSNIMQKLIFSNNIKDFYSALFSSSQITISKIISHANIAIERDPTYVQSVDNEEWMLVDPLLNSPEGENFELLEGSPAYMPSESNIGWYQSAPKNRPSTKTVYVDYDTARTAWVQNGQRAYPYQSINQALRNINPGDTVYVTAAAIEYTADFSELKLTNPGIGTVNIIGISKTDGYGNYREPVITCLNNSSNAIDLNNRAFLHLENFMIRDKTTEDNCRRTGVNVENSRHLSFKHLYIQQQNNIGLHIDSSHRIKVTSSVIFDNTAGIQTSRTITRNQWNRYDKLTVVDNLTNGMQLTNTWKSAIINSIFSENNTCLSLAAGPVSTFDLTWSFCRQSGISAADPIWIDGNNIFGQSVNPMFRSDAAAIRTTNPRHAFLLSVTNTTISPALNNGQPDYPDPTAVLPEFPYEGNWSIGQTKSETGRMDMGAFEQSKTDVDGDGLHNRTEQEHGLNPNSSHDATEDADSDGINNFTEITQHGTDPNNADTDGDGYSDGIEISIGSDPLTPNADYIEALVPRPTILPHVTEMPPTRFQLNGAEERGRSVTNEWHLISAPSGISEEDVFVNNTGFGLDVVAKKAGNYVIGLDQILTGGIEGASLRSLPAHRAITTITITDVAPTPVLPADISLTWQPGKIVYFYGSSTITDNPSFDLNGDPVQSFEWIPVSPQNPNLGIFDYTNPTPYFDVPDKTAVYSFKLSVSSFGANGNQTKISTDVFNISVTGATEGSLPIADAGKTAYGQISQVLSLNGRGSGDEDNVPLEYYWRQTAGHPVQFVGPSYQPLNIFEPAASTLLTTQAALGQTPQFVAGNIGAVEFELVVAKEVRTNGIFRKIYSEPDRVWYIIDSEHNAAPVALISNAGSLNVNTQATINGEGSRDRIASGSLGSASAISFNWQQTDGPPLYLAETTNSSLQFTPVEMGFYTFALIVTDQTGISSAPDYLTVAVGSPEFRLPAAVIDTPDPSLINRTVMLSGNASTGGSVEINGVAQEFPILAWYWKQTGGPELVKLATPSAANISFRPTKSGNYNFELRVATSNYISPPAEISVSVNSDTQSIPVASTTGKTVFNLNEEVILDGSASYDNDNDPLTYFWRQTSGDVVFLDSQTEKIVRFTPQVTGIYEFELVVYDGKSESLPKYTTISVIEAITGSVNQPNPYSFDPTTILPDSSNGGGCFIVSASFGKDSRIVAILSEFRDRVLLKTAIGKIIVAKYYELSPAPAKIISSSPLLRFLTRLLLLTLFLLPPILISAIPFSMLFFRKNKK
jgi:hypothetical protein